MLAGLSNFLAQAITSYRSQKPFRLDVLPLLHFVAFALLSCPPNFKWQQFLERKFPGYTTAEPLKDKDKPVSEQDPLGKKKFNIPNTAIKFTLDQSIGAVVNTLLFIAGIGALQGKGGEEILSSCQQNFWPIVLSGVKLWPIVSLFCFTLVPVERRVVVGGIVGVFWGIYLSLVAAG